MKRRVFNAAVLAATALSSLRAWADESPPFETMEFDWADAKRQRAVPVRLYWPNAMSTQVPLVVFSHGIGGSRRGYSYLGQHWASNGSASLHLHHVGSDRNLWFGNPLGLVGRLHDAAHEREAIERPRDLRFALDQLLASPLGERIELDLVEAGFDAVFLPEFHRYGQNRFQR